MDGDLVGAEEIPKEAGVGEADAGGGDQVILHLHNGGVLPLQIQLVGDFAAGEATADDDYIFSCPSLAQEEVDGLDALVDARDGDPIGHGAGGDDHFVSTQSGNVGDLRIHFHVNGMSGNLPSVPCDQIPVLFLEGGGGSRDEDTAQFPGLFIQGDLVAPLAQHQG